MYTAPGLQKQKQREHCGPQNGGCGNQGEGQLLEILEFPGDLPVLEIILPQDMAVPIDGRELLDLTQNIFQSQRIAYIEGDFSLIEAGLLLLQLDQEAAV